MPMPTVIYLKTTEYFSWLAHSRVCWFRREAKCCFANQNFSWCAVESCVANQIFLARAKVLFPHQTQLSKARCNCFFDDNNRKFG